MRIGSGFRGAIAVCAAENVSALSIGLKGVKLAETISFVFDAGQALLGTVQYRFNFEMKLCETILIRGDQYD